MRRMSGPEVITYIYEMGGNDLNKGLQKLLNALMDVKIQRKIIKNQKFIIGSLVCTNLITIAYIIYGKLKSKSSSGEICVEKLSDNEIKNIIIDAVGENDILIEEDDIDKEQSNIRCDE